MLELLKARYGQMSTQSLLEQVELLYAGVFDTWSPFSALRC